MQNKIIIQLLLSLSRRYRTASVQEKARNLVTQIAERNGWSSDELADRTIPTAGFDDQNNPPTNNCWINCFFVFPC